LYMKEQQLVLVLSNHDLLHFLYPIYPSLKYVIYEDYQGTQHLPCA
jgi:hypothetical protein